MRNEPVGGQLWAVSGAATDNEQLTIDKSAFTSSRVTRRVVKSARPE
jgi:hypothetical protein